MGTVRTPAFDFGVIGPSYGVPVTLDGDLGAAEVNIGDAKCL
jgi:hypothetical protein